MICGTGNLMPHRLQLAHARKFADDSFCTSITDEFNNLPIPKIEGFENSGSGVLLRLRNVEPHEDPWVENSSAPRARRALFWLMETSPLQRGSGFSQTRLGGVWFGCGDKQIKMQAGDWVLFNDAKKHWVMSDHIWRGASWQLQKAVTKS